MYMHFTKFKDFWENFKFFVAEKMCQKLSGHPKLFFAKQPFAVQRKLSEFYLQQKRLELGKVSKHFEITTSKVNWDGKD